MKRCSKCGQDKELSEFYRRSDGLSDGYRSYCRDCSRRTPSQSTRRRAIRAMRPESAILSGIIQRCNNPNNPSFQNYGARGITVCREWVESLEAFLADMGPRPSPAHSIERIDNSKGYEPMNCRWATKQEQNRNTRQNVMITVHNKTMCRSEWAELSGVEAKVIRDRIEKLGWDAERAIFTPTRKCEGRAA